MSGSATVNIHHHNVHQNIHVAPPPTPAVVEIATQAAPRSRKAWAWWSAIIALLGGTATVGGIVAHRDNQPPDEGTLVADDVVYWQLSNAKLKQTTIAFVEKLRTFLIEQRRKEPDLIGLSFRIHSLPKEEQVRIHEEEWRERCRLSDERDHEYNVKFKVKAIAL